MSDFESHGNGLSGRVDGPFFDARHILMPGSLVLGTMGEAMQTDAEQLQANGENVPDLSGVGNVFEFIATMPPDAKAVGIALAAAASVQMVHAARTARNIAVENAIIGAGLDRQSAVLPPGTRALKRAGSWVIAALAGWGAYKTGEHLTAQQALVADLGLIGSGVLYLSWMNKRLTGRW